MDKEQELEWDNAQKIVVSIDLVAAAKKQLLFLAAVDGNRGLYEGPLLQRAIYRYNACWLPLLVKHVKSPLFEGPLVVPLDCEWIWHCHRLNPVQYKNDCEKLYGQILDNDKVVSSVQETSARQTIEIWNTLYPGESYSFDLTVIRSEDVSKDLSEPEKYTSYDLVSAVKRQSPFFYQVSRPHVSDDRFIEEAMARYKGFLHLIKTNKDRSIKRFCVPTYDIDLLWHTHQLHPVSYCKDMNSLLGKVLEHDDMDADRTKGKKLDVGFSGTTKQWEDTYGIRYWKAGAMHRGNAPIPVTNTPFLPKTFKKKVASSESEIAVPLCDTKAVEVVLEVVGVRNLPEGHKGSLFVLYSKRENDMFFNIKRRLTILSESGTKQVASFKCEPTGDLLFELISPSPSNLPLLKQSKTLGTLSVPLSELLSPYSKLSVEQWYELKPSSGNVPLKPIMLRIALSFTVPIIAPIVVRMVRSKTFLKGSCFFSLPVKNQKCESWTRIVDDSGTEIMNLRMSDFKKEKGRKEVVGVTESGETRRLAEVVGSGWSLIDGHWSLQLKNKSSEEDHLFELMGNKVVKIYRGRKLDFEAKHCERLRNDRDFMTSVEFSAEHPYGKAVALLDLKYGLLKVNEGWFVLAGIITSFILSDKEGYKAFTENEENLELENSMNHTDDGNYADCENGKPTTNVEQNNQLNLVAGIDAMTPMKSGGCGGGGCGSGCGNAVNSGGCGSGCGNMVNSGGCGGCGGGCGNMVNSSGCGGCGSGCGGGCGNMVNSGGGGNMVSSGGCGGGGCGGGCGNQMKSGGGCGGCGTGCGGGCGNKFGSTTTPIPAN